MTDNKIIKEATEAYRQDLDAGCYVGDLLGIITRKNEEIESLEAEIDKQYEQAKADILGNMADGGTSCHWCIDQHRAKAIREFAERLKAEATLQHGGVTVVYGSCIDNLVKEMTEDTP